ncbi:MAG: asparaginase [Candidatus Cloacimonetes bacterium]|nr:asparaginase [Candidatus Cloacimonadota bacterium]
MKKKILIVTTGGTIAMKQNSPFGVVPDDEFTRALLTFPHLNDLAAIHVHEFANLPSPYITPQKMLELAKFVDANIAAYDGLVITHGTDTLEETAYFLDLVLQTEKPVVFTAAMRSASDLGLDGPRNIVGAVRVASNRDSHGKGVLVVMNDEIHYARDVVKTDSGKTDAFLTPAYGLLGIIDPDRVIYYRQSYFREKLHTTTIETNIDLIKCVSGMDDRHLVASLQAGARAVVLEAFGRGNIPPQIIPAVRNLMENNILVIVVSRTYTGRVLPEYGYEGGGAYLEKIGVILGGDLKGPKMRLKLMILFGKFPDPERVREYLRQHN